MPELAERGNAKDMAAPLPIKRPGKLGTLEIEQVMP
jgi:hypothetical protein